MAIIIVCIGAGVIYIMNQVRLLDGTEITYAAGVNLRKLAKF